MKLQLSKCGKAAFSMVLPFCSAQGKDLFYLKIHWDKDPIKSFFPIPNEREIRAMQENEPKKVQFQVHWRRNYYTLGKQKTFENRPYQVCWAFL